MRKMARCDSDLLTYDDKALVYEVHRMSYIGFMLDENQVITKYSVMGKQGYFKHIHCSNCEALSISAH